MGIHRMAQCLAADGIASGAQYVSSWKAFIRKHDDDQVFGKGWCQAQHESWTLAKVRPWSTQAAELDVEALNLLGEDLQVRSPIAEIAPLNPGCPIFPVLTVMIMVVWMFGHRDAPGEMPTA